MDEKGFGRALEENANQLGGEVDVTSKAIVDTTKIDLTKPELTFEEKLQASFDAKPKGILDRELKAEEVLGRNELGLLDTKISPRDKTIAELYPDRETIDVPIGFEKKTPDPLSKFATKETPYYEYDLKTKTVFKDQLTDAQIEAIDIENTDYYAKFQNNRVDKIKTYINTNYKDSQGAFTDEYKNLTSDMLERKVLGEDVKAIGPTSALVGSILAPQEEEKGTGSQVHIPALPTSTELNRYEGGVSDAYRALGYKGPQNMAGFHMAGAYGNTPYNFMQNRIAMPQLTTAMPQLG